MTEQTATVDLTLDPRLSQTSFVDYAWNWPTATRAAIYVCDYLDGQGQSLTHITPACISLNDEGQVDIGTAELQTAVPFLAPEVREGGAVTPASQVYNVAAILYYFLLGYPPLGNVRSIDQDAPDTPAELKRVLFNALAVDPAERTATVHELRANLFGVLSPPTWGNKLVPKLPLDDETKARLEGAINKVQQRWLRTRDKIPWQRVGQGQRRLTGATANQQNRQAITIVGMLVMILLYLALFTSII